MDDAKLQSLQNQAELLAWAVQTIRSLQTELDVLRRQQKLDQEYISKIMEDTLLCPQRSRFFCDDETAPMTHGCRQLRGHVDTEGQVSDMHKMAGIKYLPYDELCILRQFYREHIASQRK